MMYVYRHLVCWAYTERGKGRTSWDYKARTYTELKLFSTSTACVCVCVCVCHWPAPFWTLFRLCVCVCVWWRGAGDWGVLYQQIPVLCGANLSLLKVSLSLCVCVCLCASYNRRLCWDKHIHMRVSTCGYLYRHGYCAANIRVERFQSISWLVGEICLRWYSSLRHVFQDGQHLKAKQPDLIRTHARARAVPPVCVCACSFYYDGLCVAINIYVCMSVSLYLSVCLWLVFQCTVLSVHLYVRVRRHTILSMSTWYTMSTWYWYKCTGFCLVYVLYSASVSVGMWMYHHDTT